MTFECPKTFKGNNPEGEEGGPSQILVGADFIMGVQFALAKIYIKLAVCRVRLGLAEDLFRSGSYLDIQRSPSLDIPLETLGISWQLIWYWNSKYIVTMGVR